LEKKTQEVLHLQNKLEEFENSLQIERNQHKETLEEESKKYNDRISAAEVTTSPFHSREHLTIYAVSPLHGYFLSPAGLNTGGATVVTANEAPRGHPETVDDEENKFICNACSKVFKKKHGLTQHMNKYPTGSCNSPCICKCGKKFGQRNWLARHQKSCQKVY
jgi:uncharacterized C2H2 Zn-finger protein